MKTLWQLVVGLPKLDYSEILLPSHQSLPTLMQGFFLSSPHPQLGWEGLKMEGLVAELTSVPLSFRAVR